MGKRICLNRVKMMNNSIFDSTKWAIFKIEDVFSDIFIAKASDSNSLKQGIIPFIGRSFINNGLQGEYCINNKKIVKRNCLTIGMVGNSTCFYQAFDFASSQNILVLRINKKITRYSYFFLVTVINKYLKTKGYNYGMPVSLKRIRKDSLILPCDSQDNINWEFMENCMKEKEKKIIRKYQKYAEKIIRTKKDIVPSNEKEWEEFSIESLFELETGKSKGLNHIEISQVGYNYLGATNQNNGVLCQVKVKKELIQKGNCIAFIRNGEGSMGYSVYKAESFVATSDITAGYNIHLNRYNGTFITTIADRVRGKYNFGYKRSGSRLDKEKLLLPVTEEGTPDYYYMEQYMKNLEAKHLEIYLKYVENKNIV